MRRKPLSKRGQRTGLEVVEEIKAGVGCDIGYGCLEYETKFTEFDPRLRGLEVVQQTMGWGGAPGVWTASGD